MKYNRINVDESAKPSQEVSRDTKPGVLSLDEDVAKCMIYAAYNSSPQ